MSGSGTKRKRMLSIVEIDAGLREVADLARAAGIDAVLVGGVALYQYGSDRLTSDIDFAASEPLDTLPNEGSLTFGGYQSHTPSGVPVDWIMRDDDYSEVFNEALQYSRHVDGVPVPVASPEYMVAMKMVARRKKDAADLEALLQSDVVDYTKARRIVKRLLGPYAADELDLTAAVARWKRETGRE